MNDYDGYGAMRDLSSEIAQLRAALATLTAERDGLRHNWHQAVQDGTAITEALAEERNALHIKLEAMTNTVHAVGGDLAARLFHVARLAACLLIERMQEEQQPLAHMVSGRDDPGVRLLVEHYHGQKVGACDACGKRAPLVDKPWPDEPYKGTPWRVCAWGCEP